MWKMSPSVFLHTMEEGNSVYKGQFTRRVGALVGQTWTPGHEKLLSLRTHSAASDSLHPRGLQHI